MLWNEAVIETLSSEDGTPSEIVTAMLMELGIMGIETEDAYEARLFLENSAGWDYADEVISEAQRGAAFIKFYAEESTGGELLRQVRQGLEGLKNSEFAPILGSLQMTVKVVDDGEWADNWKRYYKPFRVGERIVICPVWEEYEGEQGDIKVVLNPGPMFGTGLHQTTRMCIEALECYIKPGARVLDMGCGSGILAITALMLSGSGSAVAVDNDPVAEKVVRENAGYNGISESRLRFAAGNILTEQEAVKGAEGSYDIILANIVADVINEMIPLFAGWLAEGGVLITSGIIRDRLEDVKARLADNGLKVLKVINSGEWIAAAASL